MQILTLAAAIFCLGIGITLLLANPRRPSNRAFVIFSLILTAWLACVFGAMVAGAAREAGGDGDLEFWFRANAFVSSFAPWSIWLLKNAIVLPMNKGDRALLDSVPVLVISVFLAGLCFSSSFVLPETGLVLRRGFVYFLHTSIGVVLYLVTAVEISRQLRAQSGIRRLELQYLAYIAGIASLMLVSLNGLGNYFHYRPLNRSSILVVFVAYLFMAWALANHRIFNARHVLTAVGHRMAVVGILAGSAWGLSLPLAQVMSETAAWVASTFVCGTAVFWLDQKTRTWMGLSDELLLVAFRSEVIHTARQEAGSGRLAGRFEQLLASHHRASFAAILGPQGDKYAGSGIEFSQVRSGFTALCECSWITPESLQRRRSTPGLADLAAFLRQHSLGVIVTVPRGSPTPTMLVAVGTKTNEWPFTYPEVQRLQNATELMDSILTRSWLTDQAAMRTRMEHLAMMSRGLAHDLKNLITPVSAFLIHTDGHYPEGGPEAEVHAAARRSVRVMIDYLREALFFSERLEPKYEPVDLTRIFDSVRAVTAMRAASRGVPIVTEQEFPYLVTADGILLQRMLANLVNNAIDASASAQKVILAATPGRTGWLRIQVTDEGHGIDPEVIDRIFDPYFTTKKFGDEVRGFGLGLTISQRIIHLHGGTIAVASQRGQGTVVTVELPSAPSGTSSGATPVTTPPAAPPPRLDSASAQAAIGSPPV